MAMSTRELNCWEHFAVWTNESKLFFRPTYFVSIILSREETLVYLGSVGLRHWTAPTLFTGLTSAFRASEDVQAFRATWWTTFVAFSHYVALSTTNFTATFAKLCTLITENLTTTNASVESIAHWTLFSFTYSTEENISQATLANVMVAGICCDFDSTFFATEFVLTHGACAYTITTRSSPTSSTMLATYMAYFFRAHIFTNS